MAQFSDGPVEWPRCIQLVHGAHSSRWCRWCPVAFPGTRINAAPLGGQKWERVSNSNCRKARKSQGMTLDGETINHYRHHLEAFTSPSRWRSHLGSSLPILLFLPTFFSSLAHTDPNSSRQAEPGAQGTSESSSTSSRSALSPGAKTPRVYSISPNNGAERSNAQQRYESVVKEGCR